MSLFRRLLPAVGTIAGGLFGGGAGAAIGGGLGSLIGGHGNQRAAERAQAQTAQNAQNYLNQINSIGRQYLEPYIQPGLSAGERANQEYDRLLNQPQDLVNSIMATYEPSSGYKFKEDYLKRGMANTAAAGGYAGTTYDAQEQGKLINALLSENMQDYLNNTLGLYNTGLLGKENIAGRGFNAASNLADYLGSNMAQQAGLTYNAGNTRNANRADYNNQTMNLAQQLGGNIWEGIRNTRTPPFIPGRGGIVPRVNLAPNLASINRGRGF